MWLSMPIVSAWIRRARAAKSCPPSGTARLPAIAGPREETASITEPTMARRIMGAPRCARFYSDRGAGGARDAVVDVTGTGPVPERAPEAESFLERGWR